MKNISLPAFAGGMALTAIATIFALFFVVPLAHAQAVPTDLSVSDGTIPQADLTTIESEIASITAAIQAIESEIATMRASGQLGMSSGSCYMYSQDLAVGSTGADVTALQNMLITKGYLNIPEATGYFGTLTQQALEQWQVTTNLASSSYGYVDVATRALLNAPCMTTTTTTIPPITVTTPPVTTLQPSISTVSPGTSAAGGQVTVTGSGFNATGNMITFSGVGGTTILSNVPSSNNMLSFAIPVNASTTGAMCAPLNTASTTECMSPGSYIITVGNGFATSTGSSITISQ